MILGDILLEANDERLDLLISRLIEGALKSGISPENVEFAFKTLSDILSLVCSTGAQLLISLKEIQKNSTVAVSQFVKFMRDTFGEESSQIVFNKVGKFIGENLGKEFGKNLSIKNLTELKDVLGDIALTFRYYPRLMNITEDSIIADVLKCPYTKLNVSDPLVCYLECRLLEGFVNGLTGKEFEVKLEKCMAKNDDVCKYLIKLRK